MPSVFCEASKGVRHNYVQHLRAVSSISNLFSDSKTPYIDYRIVENLFCKCFDAENLSRSCIAIDARLGTTGIGIKTFVDTPFQKIAEFDKKRSYTDTGDVCEDAARISHLRNERLDFSRDAYAVDSFIYHYVVRRESNLSIHECPMDYIDIDNIKVTKSTEKGFDFTDGKNLYKFSRSKSTILESFNLLNPLYSFGVELIDDPTEALMKIYSGELVIEGSDEEEDRPTLILPLFSKRGTIHVPEKSGLNQWNASGRPRDPDEIYIPYNKDDRDRAPGFFPGRDVPFDLELPNGETISAKVCQEEGKAIMSNPNKDLGRWLLRDVLHLEEKTIVTMDMLDDLGINAVIFTKEDDGKYSIDFTRIDDY
jgi:hypothetical protein